MNDMAKAIRVSKPSPDFGEVGLHTQPVALPAEQLDHASFQEVAASCRECCKVFWC